MQAETVAQVAPKATAEEDHDDNDDHDATGNDDNRSSLKTATNQARPNPNQGTLILDATCTPADVHYPTDAGLLNEAREKLDEMIDVLHNASGKQTTRPRTYREKARRNYLLLSKQRSPRKNKIRQAIKKQLQFTRRNLRIVDSMLATFGEKNDQSPLSNRQQKLLVTIRELLEQQTVMYTTRCHRVTDRIVSLHQPHVRPIVRGKAGVSVEFGAKVAISLENGFSRIEKLVWDPYNEAGTLIETVEQYRERNGCYPNAVLADRIYRNRENLVYCKERGIRLSGPRLGRPPANKKMGFGLQALRLRFHENI